MRSYNASYDHTYKASKQFSTIHVDKRYDFTKC